jgi:DNA-binding transcriptional MerR regulator
MPLIIKGETYFRTHEVCRIAGISKSTLFRWLEENVLDGPTERDWRGWRLFTHSQIEKIKSRTTEYPREVLE